LGWVRSGQGFGRPTHNLGDIAATYTTRSPPIYHAPLIRGYDTPKPAPSHGHADTVLGVLSVGISDETTLPPMAKIPPDQVLNMFFKTLMQNQCHICWNAFSKKSQDDFLAWTVADIANKNPEAVKISGIGPKEIRLMFENNDVSLMKSFWKRFFFQSHANEFFRYGYYTTKEINGNKATVMVTFKYPDGREATLDVQMLNEKGAWRFAYLESGLPF
jgi:hypothetical protein